MRGFTAVLAVAGVLAFGQWAGPASAADKAPEPGTWEYVIALETGSLPAESGSSTWKHEPRVIGAIDVYEAAAWPYEAAMTETGSSPGGVFRITEIGGIKYRVGVDLGP